MCNKHNRVLPYIFIVKILDGSIATIRYRAHRLLFKSKPHWVGLVEALTRDNFSKEIIEVTTHMMFTGGKGVFYAM